VVPYRKFRIRSHGVGPLRRNRANPSVIKAQQEALAGAVGSLTDAETPLPGIRVEWVSYSDKLLRGNRSVCIPN
jgi:hypothetical protein